MNDGVYILKSEDDLIAHEKALYRNFYHTYPEYSKKFFSLVGKKRLRPNMPYESQIIYGVKHAGMLVSSGSFCVDKTQVFEIETMGFKVEKTDSVCEGLHFYSTIAETVGLDMSLYRKLLSFSFHDLLNRNFNTIYSSCSVRLIKLYRFIGFEIVDETMFEGEKEYLIKMKITSNFENEVFKFERMIQ